MSQEHLFFEMKHHKFELIFNYKDAFDKDLFFEKYVDILDDRDFIIGDISHEKLRLTGFITTKEKNSPRNIANLEDFLLEYCNLGCPFFVIKRIK
ncbi:YutD family protein [Gemella sp. GL1.1]|nr:YutD family protein [Gemella sp. GL1.1]MBF0746107.1 YutD family protein [Gemella sp. 19428wG2_WT2a]NYS27372.1 YutD family protein [Gemella sp. GL1]TFU60612.1 DUF1027 domain-containing protein [Gemella sp. WT2a]